MFLINFWGFTRLRYFTKCTLKSIAKISHIASYILLRTRAKVKFINSKIYVVIYNFITNIVLTAISVFKLTCLLNILTKLATFTVTSGNFGFAGVSVSNFGLYQIILKGASYTPTKKTVLCSSFDVRSICVSFKTFWRSLSNRGYVRLSTWQPITRGLLSLVSNVFPDTALALKTCSLTSSCL